MKQFVFIQTNACRGFIFRKERKKANYDVYYDMAIMTYLKTIQYHRQTLHLATDCLKQILLFGQVRTSCHLQTIRHPWFPDFLIRKTN